MVVSLGCSREWKKEGSEHGCKFERQNSEIQRRCMTGGTSSRRRGANRVEPIGRENFEWCDRLSPENVGRQE